MFRFSLRFLSVIALLAAMAARGMAAEPQQKQVANDHAEKMERGLELFKKEVRPLLLERCISCHGGDVIEGEFNLATREALLQGGSSGEAVQPGSSKKSRLYRLITHAEQPHMPYEEDKLTARQIELIAEWIDCGAPFDGPLAEGDAQAADWTESVVAADARDFWSFRPLAPSLPPDVRDADRCRTPIDRFVYARLDSKGITPNPETGRRRLIRRAYFDLLGLPPEPAEIEAFVNDPAPDAYERLVDRLLCSPHYGERWARYWLDLSRFAESHGFEHDYDRPSAYHFRDFVIQALNDDLPYHTFVKWQLAGDEFAPHNNLAMMATGFLAAGVHSTQITKNEVEKHRYDELDDMLATTGTAMLGLTIGCARCHDHKYDPIPQRDYYRLLAAFTTTVRSEVSLNFDKHGYQKAKQPFDREHAPLLAARERFETDELAARFEQWEQNHSTGDLPRWIELDVTSFEPPKGAGFEKLDDGSVLLVGDVTESGQFTAVADTHLTGIRAVRLEALWHPSLPNLGPGRAADGHFALSDFHLQAGPLDGDSKPADVKLLSARATFAKEDAPITAAVDADRKTAWSIEGQCGVNHAAVFDVENEIGHPGGTRLTFTFRFTNNQARSEANQLGRFRLSVRQRRFLPAAAHRGRPNGIGRPSPRAAQTPNGGLTAEQPGELQDIGIPERVLALLEKPSAERTTAERASILGWYRRVDPAWQAFNQRVLEHEKTAPKPNLVKVLVSSEGLEPIRLHSQGADFFEEVFFLRRGDPNQEQGVAAPGYLQVLMTDDTRVKHWRSEPLPEARTSYRRTSLANWITDVERGAGHLLARVIVNRLWQHHLGTGIVTTPSDFGARGAPPSHPELLDWLAIQLIEHGWRLKPIHRMIMTSSVYRQSCDESALGTQLDPENKLFHRHPYQRLEAEVVRDALMAVGGRLDRRMFGQGTLDTSSGRRSIYFTVKRSKLVPMMQVFDAPDALSGVGRRPSTTVAPQALFLMNNEVVRECAHGFARRLEHVADESIEAAVRAGYSWAVGRPPEAAELREAVAFLDRQIASHADGDRANPRHLALTDFCQALLCLNEFVYVE